MIIIHDVYAGWSMAVRLLRSLVWLKDDGPTGPGQVTEILAILYWFKKLTSAHHYCFVGVVLCSGRHYRPLHNTPPPPIDDTTLNVSCVCGWALLCYVVERTTQYNAYPELSTTQKAKKPIVLCRQLWEGLCRDSWAEPLHNTTPTKQ